MKQKGVPFRQAFYQKAKRYIPVRLLWSLSEAAAKGGTVAMGEWIIANVYMKLGVGAKIMFYIYQPGKKLTSVLPFA